MGEQPTIDDLKALQARHGIAEHLVWIGPDDFVIAHTDEERATIDLKDCELHRWLRDLDGPPHGLGYYVAVPHEPDAYSESLHADPFDLHPVQKGRWVCKHGSFDTACCLTSVRWRG